MAREKEGYRDCLERLDKKFPDKEILKYADLIALFKRSRTTIIRSWQPYYNKAVGGIPKTTVARVMCS
jgi:hypothetical protein